jgi:hypothetical protein
VRPKLTARPIDARDKEKKKRKEERKGERGSKNPTFITGLGYLSQNNDLDGPVIEYRWGTRFFAPVQNGAGDHPMDTWSFSWG